MSEKPLFDLESRFNDLLVKLGIITKPSVETEAKIPEPEKVEPSPIEAYPSIEQPPAIIPIPTSQQQDQMPANSPIADTNYTIPTPEAPPAPTAKYDLYCIKGEEEESGLYNATLENVQSFKTKLESQGYTCAYVPAGAPRPSLASPSTPTVTPTIYTPPEEVAVTPRGAVRPT